MNELHLFAGIGGGILAGQLLGHRCVAAVEIDPYCRRVLQARQQSGHLEEFPIHDDIRTFDGTLWRDHVDIVAGGFPCQDVSAAGNRAGLDGARSGLWWEMLRVVRAVRPRYVFVENVAGLLVRGFDRVLGSLADLGFDAEWTVLAAQEVGAPHIRKRLWILAAHPDGNGWRQQREAGDGAPPVAEPDGSARALADADGRRQQGLGFEEPRRLGGARGDLADRRGEVRQQQHAAAMADAERELQGCAQGSVEGHGEGQAPADAAGCGGGRRALADAGLARSPASEQEELRRARGREEGRAAAQPGWWSAEPDVGRMAHGVPSRVDRLRTLGNAQVPLQAATAFRILMERFA